MHDTANLGTVLEWQFPGLGEQGGYEVQDTGEGSGAFIALWDEEVMGRPEPTAAELDSWELPAMQAAQRRYLNRSANANYMELYIQDGEYLEFERDAQTVREIKESGRLAGGPAAPGGQNKSWLLGKDTRRIETRDLIEVALDAKKKQVNEQTSVEGAQAVTWEHIERVA